jgi:hypothetical protein
VVAAFEDGDEEGAGEAAAKYESDPSTSSRLPSRDTLPLIEETAALLRSDALPPVEPRVDPPEFWRFNSGVEGSSMIYRLVRALLRGRDRVVDVDLLVVPLDSTFEVETDEEDEEGGEEEEGDDALERLAVGDGEPRRVPSVLFPLLTMLLLPAVLGAAVFSPNLSNSSPSADVSSSKDGGDIHGRVKGRWANWMTIRIRQLKRRPVAQANMLTLRRTVLLPPPPR